MDIAALIPLITVAIAVVGAILAALKFNREGASAVVAQQSTVLTDMKALNDELAEAAARIRAERDELIVRVLALTAEVAACTAEVRLLEDQVHQLRSDLRAKDSPPLPGGRRDMDA